MNDLVLVDTADGIATIRLHRPDRLNSMTPELLDQLLAATEEVADDPGARVVVVTGAGRGFCAGGDLSAGAGGGIMSDGSASPTSAACARSCALRSFSTRCRKW